MAVWPIASAALSEVIVRTGGSVSIERESEAPVALAFPSASANLPASITIPPAPVNPAVGVKIAV